MHPTKAIPALRIFSTRNADDEPWQHDGDDAHHECTDGRQYAEDVQLVALTGGIAAGKSLVSARLRELGAVVIDADLLAREAVAPGSPGLAKVVEAFGPGILRRDGSLDRAALGAIVFTDPERLRVLNGITHPEVGRLSEQALAAAEAADPDAIVVYDIPLLAETWERQRGRFGRVIVVTADEDTRLRRMVEQRGMSESDARARIASQASERDRLRIATDVIRNDGLVDDTLRQVDELWAGLHDGDRAGRGGDDGHLPG